MQEILDSANRISALDSQEVEVVSRSSANNESSSKDVPVHVSFLVDRSGSMAPLVDDVIGGFNSFLESQKNEPGECNMTLVQFDGADPFEILEKDKPIDEIPNLEHGRYLPRGNTPLLDALGDLITYCDERSSKEVIKSDQVVAVFTDGHENASHRWGRQALFNVIEKRKKEGWIFIFMGANQDSYLEAGRLGFDNENIQNYRGDSSGTRMAYSSMGDKLGEYRRGDYNMKQSRKRDFFEGDKRAEFDHQTRK
jgi:Mg-chelatase subunit ChlD